MWKTKLIAISAIRNVMLELPASPCWSITLLTSMNIKKDRSFTNRTVITIVFIFRRLAKMIEHLAASLVSAKIKSR